MKLHFTIISLAYFLFSLFLSSTLSAETVFNSRKIESIDCDITGNVSIQQINCHGADSGVLTLDIMGGIPPYTYLWSNGGVTETITDLPPAIYSVTVTDTDDCTFELSVELTEPSFLFANVSTNTESAAGANDGNATAIPYGGISPYTYQWNDINNSTSAAISNLAVGDYTVTVTDANNCISIQTVTINVFGCSVTVVNTISQITCIGDCDGLSGALVGNGMPPYNYEWNTGATSANISGLCEGIYIVTVTDINGCNQQNEVIIIEPALLEVEVVNVINIGCFGTDEGVITVQGTGGRSPYHYIWSNGEEENTIDSLGIGTYTVTVTGRGDCFAVMSIDITQAPVLELAIDEINNINCSDGTTGSASVLATGGTGTYDFDWSNGAEGSTADDLVAGTYTVTVIDASDCTAEISIEITQSSSLEVTVTAMEHVSCFGAADGFADVEVTGGEAGYTYVWSNGATSNTIEGLTPDVYVVTVTDAGNCMAEMTVEITQPPALDVTVISSNNVTCFGEANGAIEIGVMGGTANYTYLWSNGAIENNINELATATYVVTVTDANNCIGEMNFDITAPEILELSVMNINDVTCFGESDGAASIQAVGGTAGYDYIWSNGTTDNIIAELDAGTYNATVTDANSCTTEISLDIISPAELLLSLENAENISCFGENDGSIEVMLSGGVAPFIITWSNGATGAVVNELTEGEYTATVSDGNACAAEVAISIVEPLLLELSIENISNVACGGNSGGATVLANGGTGNYSYMWSNGMPNNEVSGLPAGNYSVSVFDENDCFASVDVDIIVGEDNETPTIIIQTAEIFLDENGVANLSINQVNNGSFDNCEIASMMLSDTAFDCSHLGMNTVMLTITDASGNTAQAETDVTVTDNIIPQISCPDDIVQANDGFVVTYLSPVLSDNCVVQGFPILETGLLSGAVFPEGLTTISYSYADESNNTATCSFEVTVTTGLTANYTIAHVSCHGDTDGSITVEEVAGYTYLWEDGSTFSQIQDLTPGVYNLTITDGGTLETILNIEVLEAAPLGVNVELITHEINGNSNGSIDITPTGGVAPYTFEWYFNDELFSELGDMLALPAGDYTLIITDKNGCEFISDVITVESVTGLDETVLDSKISISPNPAQNTLFVNFAKAIKGELKLQLFTAQGQLVLTQDENPKEAIELNVEALTTGVYFLMVQSEEGNWVKKFIVER